MSILNLPIVFSGLAILYLLYRRLTRNLIAELPGPKPETFVLGNLRQYFQSPAGEIDFKWHEEYGDVFRYNGLFGEDRLFVLDPKAIQYIYQTAEHNFPRSTDRREIHHILSGGGILMADGDEHKRQKKILQPAFAPKELKSLVPLFSLHASKLSNKWKDLILGTPGKSSTVDVPRGVSCAAFDAMGAAFFDYEFDALDNEESELGRLYRVFGTDISPFSATSIFKQLSAKYLPQFLFKWESEVPNPQLDTLRYTARVIEGVAKSLIGRKAEALISGKGNCDLLTMLVRANMSQDEKTRMSDQQIISQMRTFLFAGFLTTALTLSWLLLEIARHSDVQTKLREEIFEMERKIRDRGDDGFTASDFESMPYLTAVTKETLRFHPTVHNLPREVLNDDVIPLSKSIVTSSGKVVREIPVQKGMTILTSVNAYNRHKDIFGADPHTFKPDRWLTTSGKGDKGASVGVYGALMSFGNGVRSCIGWRFAVLEVQTFVVELLANFEFSLTPEALAIRREGGFLLAPHIEGHPEKGIQLPLNIKLATREI